MSKGTMMGAVPSTEGAEGEVLPAAVPASADARRAWAQALVDRARSEGVALTGEDGLLTSMVREVLQAGLDVEMAEHLGYEPYEPVGRNSGNSRNGSYPKTVKTDVGPVQLRVPRDREGTFEPVTVPKHVRRLEGLGANVLSLYAKGLTTGEIQAHLAEIYDTEVSRETISKITDAVLPDLAAWQSRPLERVYPVVLIDAIVVKIRGSQVASPTRALTAAPRAGRGAEMSGWA
jgi:putative transposase